jgi:uncharacterized membrane protein
MATMQTVATPTDAGANRRRVEATMAHWIGLVLRVGVYLAGALIALGTLLAVLGQGGVDSRDEALGKGVELSPLGPSGILRGLQHGDGTALIQLGVLVLILTPTARVGMTLILFLKQRDRIFVALAGIVFVILALGLVGIGG